jgi:hypothetical protein
MFLDFARHFVFRNDHNISERGFIEIFTWGGGGAADLCPEKEIFSISGLE